jgi:hypothetical protein
MEAEALCAGLEVIIAMMMKSPVLGDVTLCSQLKVNGRYDAKYLLIFRIKE